ncbi:tRNA lysidine(34) synthetase TilS [Rhizobium alvei]|uniref:tRNA(Ile)-lysidine synthase n=1 Tax=Rhizobium alvei TaxID=1132659 RepID=A0ABT8YMQ7_9HYPH|nr:tRNA lysidine(34) synthetase TilS [Rhizobium alvei]MDO6964510.1 tRNA lysidine(34) synthetase TilS [Rhizobium alvei]
MRTFVAALPPNTKILVAFSGGSDSTSLLAALQAVVISGLRSDVDVIAATVDHGLRTESAEEAFAVGQFANQLGIPHSILRWEGEKPSASIQERAREARYGLLSRHAVDRGADLVLLAHTADDNRETLAMRRARDPDHAFGMVQSVLVDRRVWFHRPFLGLERAALRDYLESRALPWIEDPSNENPLFERVRIRQQLGRKPGFDIVHPCTRSALAHQAAAWLHANVTLHSTLAAEIDLTGFAFDDPAVMLGLTSVIAVIGGRPHRPGQEQQMRLGHMLRNNMPFRVSFGRCLIERRRHRLSVVREARGIDPVTIEPGTEKIWDGRFRIKNVGEVSAIIRDAGEGIALVAPLLDSGLGNRAQKAANAARPALATGSAEELTIEPILAPYDRFLPIDLLPLAATLAQKAGLSPFVAPPTPLLARF